MLFFQHSPLIPWHNSQGSFDMVGANYIPSTLWLVKDIKMLWFVKDIKMLWYDWCEIHTLMRQSDWCDLHTQMQQSDRRKIHTQMRRSDRCELHTILHANIEWFFLYWKNLKNTRKTFRAKFNCCKWNFHIWFRKCQCDGLLISTQYGNYLLKVGYLSQSFWSICLLALVGQSSTACNNRQ